MADRLNVPVHAGRENVPTHELEVGGIVVLKRQEWLITAIDHRTSEVTVERNGIKRKSPHRPTTWFYHAPIKDELEGRVHARLDGRDEATNPAQSYGPDSSEREDLMTVQEYLRAVGMPEEDLEGNAKTFGTVVMRLYRERHGKQAKATKKLEYVPYLDINGLEAQRPNSDAPPHLRVRQNGWYESNAFPVEDLDLLDRVREMRHPSLPSLAEAFRSAVDVLIEANVYQEYQRDMLMDVSNRPQEVRQVHWLVEEAVQKCLNSGVVCGHGECTKRRSKQAKRVSSYQMEEMDWS